MRSELHPILDLAQSLPPDELAVLLGELRTIELIAHGRLTSPAVAREDSLLDIKECARRMHTSKDWLYRNSGKLNFTRRVGRKLLFSSSGLDAYLKRAR
jgi:hypothetical protein